MTCTEADQRGLLEPGKTIFYQGVALEIIKVVDFNQYSVRPEGQNNGKTTVIHLDPMTLIGLTPPSHPQ